MTEVDDYLVGTEVQCVRCSRKMKLKPFTKWHVDFDNIYDSTAKTFCASCKLEKVICSGCSAEADVADLNGWFYDTLIKNDNRTNKNRADLCPACREPRTPPALCARCNKRGEWGRGKWNDNEGHIDCYQCDMILCYDCHGWLHYNK